MRGHSSFAPHRSNRMSRLETARAGNSGDFGQLLFRQSTGSEIKNFPCQRLRGNPLELFSSQLSWRVRQPPLAVDPPEMESEVNFCTGTNPLDLFIMPVQGSSKKQEVESSNRLERKSRSNQAIPDFPFCMIARLPFALSLSIASIVGVERGEYNQGPLSFH